MYVCLNRAAEGTDLAPEPIQNQHKITMTNGFSDELDVSDPAHPLFPTVRYPIVPLITSQGRGVAKIGRLKDAADDHVSNDLRQKPSCHPQEQVK
jgi:hypothetical protein